MDGIEARLRPIPEMLISDTWRFWMKVNKTDYCWIWQGGKKDGYGTFTMSGIYYPAHRVSYYLAHGEPGPIRVLHECNNTRCVNPAHLYLGSHSQNMLQAYSDGRKSNRGTLNPRSKLYDSDLTKIRELAAQGIPHPEIGSIYNMTKASIWQIVNYDTYN